METKKVLIIDDEEDLRILMQRFFAPSGYKVFAVGNITDGLRILDEERPDIVFLDNNLPDGLGWGSIEFIKNHYPQTEVNLISAFNVPKTSASTFRILEKPILLEDLNKFIGR